ncbi:alkaline phosphatase family protein [Streptomyces sp. CB01580]|uniref:alkaline phosphatase family protein n=1 Tax=Streptomyces sp. CB01580 TaxID=1703933 RepID=UPI00093D5D68|nr:alkaline phosphatase family protein [Streptomyces sp. CB01580]
MAIPLRSTAEDVSVSAARHSTGLQRATGGGARGSGAPTAVAYAGLPSGTKQAKTLVIGIDGATFDAFSRADVPNLRQLMAKGLTARSNLYASPMAPTVSGAGWSSIATGVWPDKHNVKDNDFTNPNYGRYPEYATRLETADPAVSTLVVGTWSPVPQKIFGAKTDLRIAGGNDEGTTAKAADYLANGNPDSTFVHLDEVDGAGHSTGSASPAYIKALHTADAQVGRLLDAVASRPTYADEDWLVVVTADHDALRGSLRGPVDETRLPADAKGWPGSDSPWKVTAHAVVRTAQGEPVKGARVTAELTADGTVRELTGTTKKDGSVTFKVTVPRGVAEAALTVTDVRYRDLAYHGELDPVRTLDLDRPTGHRG